MPDGEWMVPFAALASLDRNARARASEPLMLAMLPGGAAQKTAVAAVAVTQQAREGLRQERRVAEQMVEAVTDAASNPATFDRARLAQWRALRDVASDDLVTRMKGVPSVVEQRVVDQAFDALKVAIALPKDQKLDKADMAKYPELVAHLTSAQETAIFKL